MLFSLFYRVSSFIHSTNIYGLLQATFRELETEPWARDKRKLVPVGLEASSATPEPAAFRPPPPADHRGLTRMGEVHRKLGESCGIQPRQRSQGTFPG